MYLRLKKWMDLEGLKSSELANNIKVNRATVSHILSGRNKPSIDFLGKLLNFYPKLNTNWLITGVGYMYIKQEDEKSVDSKKVEKVVVFYDDNSFDELVK